MVQIGLLVGLLLNLSGWLGNNFVLGELWSAVERPGSGGAWARSIASDALSFAPDFVYGVGIVWLYAVLRKASVAPRTAALHAGLFISLVGGIVAYFAIANSGLIPWRLAFASFALVLGTKVPLAFLGGWLLERQRGPPG